jgi:hypothetical protein
MRHMGEMPAVSWADEGRRLSSAPRFPSRSEDLWSQIPLSLTFADRSAAQPRSGPGQPP